MKAILADSDFLIGLFRVDDPHHKETLALQIYLGKHGIDVWVSNLVKQESATVISHRVGMQAVRIYLDQLDRDVEHWVWVDEKVEHRAWEIYLKETKKGSSFVDASNLAVIERYTLDGILSFDAFYPGKLRVAVPPM